MNQMNWKKSKELKKKLFSKTKDVLHLKIDPKYTKCFLGYLKIFVNNHLHWHYFYTRAQLYTNCVNIC